MRFIFPHRHVNADILSDYLDEQLPASARQRVARHLESCGHCREELESLRTTVSYLQDLPQFSTPRSFAFAVPPPEPVRVRPGVTVYVPAWAYAGAASLAGLALALLVLVDASGFSPSSPSPDFASALARSRPSAPFEAAPAVEPSKLPAPHQAPDAPTSLPAPAAAAAPAADVAQPEMAAAVVEEVGAGIAVTPTPQVMAKAAATTAVEPIATGAPVPTPATVRSGQSTYAAEATPTPQAVAKADGAVASEPLTTVEMAVTPTYTPNEPPAQPTPTSPVRESAPALAMSGGGGFDGPTTPPALPPTATLSPASTATPAPVGEAPLAALEASAPPAPLPPSTQPPAATATITPRLVVAAQPTVVPKAEAEAGPAGASTQPVGPEGAAGPAGPAVQPGDSPSPVLTDPRIDSRDESIAPRRRDSGSRWRVAQAIAGVLVILFIGGLFFEVRRSRRAGLP